MKTVLKYFQKFLLIQLILSSNYFTSGANSAEVSASMDVQKLMSQQEKFNEQCRGGSGDNPKTIAACKDRDKLYQEIVKAGWCWGPDDAFGYQKHWVRCQRKSANGGGAQGASVAFDAKKATEIIRQRVMLSPYAKQIKVESDNRAYSVTVYYESDVDVRGETHDFAVEFVRYLVSIGLDPTENSNRRSVHVCGIQDGLTTVSGKPGVNLLGCSHFNPYKDVVSWDGR
jgi:hypothetical protein